MFNFKACLLLTALSISPGAGSAEPLETAASTLKIGGTGGALGTLKIVGQAFQQIQPQATVVIVPSLSSGGGIKALQAGALDLAVIGRPLADAERGPGMMTTEYARTPFVFATAVRTQVSAITLGELLGIYSGERTSWPDGRPLRLVLRPEADSDTRTLKNLSPAMSQAVNLAHARPGMNIATTDQASADSLESIPGALGTTTLGLIISEKRALQALALNGVTPSLKTLANGEYPYYVTFSLVSGPKPRPLAQQFLAFLRSAAGQEILEKNGQWLPPQK
ncbi:substrate-binding domain-containing protein [Polaromonas sp.]|uniref:PstS family phosphate ABC transporter substrate-binding protein n=1 Tax=Polaromonas sp. TaxID=1869339 RepID=UPI00286A3420|nr:substrate-binding domain-containing protein [Polaromonas sp.]